MELHKQGRYSRTAVALHWLVATCIVATIPLGWYVASLRLSPLKLQLVSYHKWIGVTIFMLAIARLAWRSVSAAPPPLPAPAWQMRAASVVHWSLYGLMFALPLSGWIFSSATGVPTVYLGLWQLPDLVARDRALASTLRWAHQALGWLLLSLVLVHVAAVLKHQFVDRDGLLRRMGF
ncbi:MAG TPA: cytochrome b [Burkholderiaceae bacterium]|nr:cytochrome b [Burkholderiaceae bacterium]HQR69747.1 cytochrome b [Burkholderiaceae bacterium]